MTGLSIEKSLWIEDFMLTNFLCITTVDELTNHLCNIMNKEIPDSVELYELCETLEEADDERLSWILRNTFSF